MVGLVLRTWLIYQINKTHSCFICVRMSPWWSKWPFIHFHPCLLRTTAAAPLWTWLTDSDLCFSQQTSKTLYWQNVSVEPSASLHVGMIICSFSVYLLLLYPSLLLLLKPRLCIWTQARPTDGEHMWNITTAYQVQRASLGIRSGLTEMNLGFDWIKKERKSGWWRTSDGSVWREQKIIYYEYGQKYQPTEPQYCLVTSKPTSVDYYWLRWT